ncbi:MAG: transcription elongation factor GreA [Anaerovoracaceae bacterium]|jgi:transcription elongation factor GreA
MADEVLLTREGYENLKAEYEELVSVKRKEVAEELKEARAFGDISENAEYDAAKEKQAELEERISSLEDKMRNAKIIEIDEADADKVNIGNIVRIRETASGDEGAYTIVGTTETDPFANRISNESPVGKAIIGHRVGDVVEVEVKDRDIRLNYEILEIRRTDHHVEAAKAN